MIVSYKQRIDQLEKKVQSTEKDRADLIKANEKIIRELRAHDDYVISNYEQAK